ncbi:GH39 family glycosyl hydrolase [Nevskia soli]|uniref:GH39 family glycosyl hydrolase n=1 Tax=Nevskia soli TaxID=418856 RepID=UPI0015D6FFAA|nr:beta-xylosidase [Nevskia soli]
MKTISSLWVLGLILSPSFLRGQGTQPPPPPLPDGKTVSIQVDLNRPAGIYKPIYSWFGFDEANYATMPDGKRLLRELHDLSPVPVYIRSHHLFTSGDGVPGLKWSSTNVYSEDSQGRPIYDFRIVDGIFDQYRAAGVRPMVELGFMPKDLAAELPDRKVEYRSTKSIISGASNNPPKDYAKWGELVRVFTSHLVERYGRETVRRWYFEVWNEPDIDYWHSTAEDYWKLYDYAVAGVRAALPDAKVGGPATTGPGGQKGAKFLEGFLNHIRTGKSAANGQPAPLDFISFHAKGQPRTAEGHVRMGIASELRDVDKGFEIVNQFPRFRNLPIILSEADPEGCAACSSKTNPANNYRNGTLYPAYTAVAYKALFDLADRRKVDLLSMLSWSFEFEDREYFEGFRDLSTNGIDKPILNFFRMAALMDGQRVSTASTGQVPLDSILANGVRSDADIDALATVGERKAAVMVWNYHDDYEPAGASLTTITAQGIPAGVGRVLVMHYRIDDTHSNAYSVWMAMGSPQHPTTEQYELLKSRAGLELLSSPAWMDVKDGQVSVTTNMPRQSVSLVLLSWE